MKITNKVAFFEYNILDKFQAGVILTGAEAKMVRSGRVQLDHAYVRLIDGQPLLVNAVIPPYPHASSAEYHPDRTRKLLFKKNELMKFRLRLQTKGITLVPLAMYTKRNLVKVEVALAKGKQMHEKRAVIKKRDLDRELERDYKLR